MRAFSSFRLSGVVVVHGSAPDATPISGTRETALSERSDALWGVLKVLDPINDPLCQWYGLVRADHLVGIAKGEICRRLDAFDRDGTACAQTFDVRLTRQLPCVNFV
ncbi:hypothetical protein OAN307_c15940 [Octadecabacter antarcticus 307]|uniref:Uncharacterized protein n=1 Tax=Octadecabacter antarcticus 307 TaxID=391626 RepID=M9R4X4_9RHOB|nr:hypothetical protein OAN307_c15940 [Octadecabacter antarcticus 307]